MRRLLLFAAAALVSGCCFKGICVIADPGDTPTPTPTAGPTPTLTPLPTPDRVCKNALDCDCMVCIDRIPGGSNPKICDWHYIRCPEPTPTATPVPEPTETPTPTPAPTATPVPCVPAPGPDPVSMRQVPRCLPGYEPLEFLGNPTLCAIKAGEGLHRTAWRLGYGIDRQGMQLTMLRGATVQEEPGRGCTDAHGRFYPGCGDLYTHPEGPSAPYTYGGYVVPDYCGAATPTPTRPTPTPGPAPTPNTSCAPVEAINHFLAGGGGCHAWHPVEGGQVRCVLDSTVRPICDEEHQDNWNSFCGQRSHDPAYDRAAGAQLWTIHGAEDRGPNNCDTAHPDEPSPDCNSAQRVIVGPAGGEVHIVVCLRPDAKTYDGCPIPLTGDPCSRPAPWHLPSP